MAVYRELDIYISANCNVFDLIKFYKIRACHKGDNNIKKKVI